LLASLASQRPLTTETSPQGSSANILTLCDGNPARLSVLRRSIDITDQCEAFPYFILNNTDDPAIAIEEEALAVAFAAEAGSRRLVYRHRMDNTDYKASDIHDFGQ
jgi:membrane glycosyltransferase